MGNPMFTTVSSMFALLYRKGRQATPGKRHVRIRLGASVGSGDRSAATALASVGGMSRRPSLARIQRLLRIAPPPGLGDMGPRASFSGEERSRLVFGRAPSPGFGEEPYLGGIAPV